MSWTQRLRLNGHYTYHFTHGISSKVAKCTFSVWHTRVPRINWNRVIKIRTNKYLLWSSSFWNVGRHRLAVCWQCFETKYWSLFRRANCLCLPNPRTDNTIYEYAIPHVIPTSQEIWVEIYDLCKEHVTLHQFSGSPKLAWQPFVKNSYSKFIIVWY
jgi:hypothetical protein